jgi:hypothetical protein
MSCFLLISANFCRLQKRGVSRQYIYVGEWILQQLPAAA